MDYSLQISAPSKPMPIDVVVTWVDGEDPVHIAKREKFRQQGAHSASLAATRFASRDEIRYCVWSVLRFCSFIRRLYIVTDEQYPHAIDSIFAVHPSWKSKVEIVDHQTIFGEHSDLLPIFSSRSIETMMHRIPNLSEHFIYLNDDMFIGRSLGPEYFFEDGKPVLRGRFVRHPNSIFSKLKVLLHGKAASRPSFKEAQRRAALEVGREGDFLYSEHHPQPMRRSTIQNFFSSGEHSIRAQSGHRFRSAEQYSPIGLSNHLELMEGAPVKSPGMSGYVKPPHGERVRRRNYVALQNLMAGRLDTICIQSLDGMSSEDQSRVRATLENWIASSSV